MNYNIGKTIKICRTIKSVTQKDLAKMSDIAPGFLSLLESDQRDITYSTLQNIARGLSMKTSDLIKCSETGIFDSEVLKGDLHG